MKRESIVLTDNLPRYGVNKNVNTSEKSNISFWNLKF